MVGPPTYSVPLLPGPQVGLLLDHQRQGLRYLADLEGQRVKVFCRGGSQIHMNHLRTTRMYMVLM